MRSCARIERLRFGGLCQACSTRRFHLVDGFAAVPFHGVRHGRLQSVQFFGRAPADVVMFFGSERNCSIFRARPIDHANVLMAIGDAMDVEKSRRDKRASAIAGGGRALAQNFDIKPAFFLGFTKSGLLRIFVEFYVSAEGQPFVEVAMVNEKDFGFLNDEYGNREIDFFVDVGHRLVTWLKSYIVEQMRTLAICQS